MDYVLYSILILGSLFMLVFLSMLIFVLVLVGRAASDFMNSSSNERLIASGISSLLRGVGGIRRDIESSGKTD